MYFWRRVYGNLTILYITSSDEYAEEIKNHIFEALRMLDKDKISDKQFRWEF